MNGVIKGITCANDSSPAAWQPADLRNVYLPMTLYIGMPGDEAADLFQVVVATPAALKGRPERRRRKLLVVQEYNWDDVRRKLDDWVARCEQETWQSVVDCLRKYFEWEYEGMGPGAT